MEIEAVETPNRHPSEVPSEPKKLKSETTNLQQQQDNHQNGKMRTNGQSSPVGGNGAKIRQQQNVANAQPPRAAVKYTKVKNEFFKKFFLK